MANVTVGTRVEPEWKDELLTRAEKEGTDLGGLIRMIVADYLGKPCGDRVSQLERRVSSIETKLRSLS